MLPKLSAVALFVALVMCGYVTPDRAAACNIAPLELKRAAEISEIVIVGEVVDERAVNPDYPSYSSTILVDTVLKGTPGRELTFDPLGYLGAACEGGPRLAKGERVLLFVGRGVIGTQGQGPLTVVSYEDGKYLLAGAEARHAYRPSLPAEDAIRQVAAITGAGNDQLQAALAFARGEPASEPTSAAALAIRRWRRSS